MSSSSSGPLLPTLIVTGGPSDGLQIPLEAPGAEKIDRLRPHLPPPPHQPQRGLQPRAHRLGGRRGRPQRRGQRGGNVRQRREGRDRARPPGRRPHLDRAAGIAGEREAAGARPRQPGRGRGDAHAWLRPAGQAPAFSARTEEDPLIFADPAVPEKFTPAFARARSARRPRAGPAIIFEDESRRRLAPPPAATATARARRPRPHAAAAAAAAPARTGPRRRARRPPRRPDYMTEIPSIGGDRVREALEVPAEGARRAARAASGARRCASPSLRRDPARRDRGRGRGRPRRGRVLHVLALPAAAPVLSAVTPPKAEIGTTITIIGHRLRSSAADNTVRFGDTEATVTNASATSLTVTVPDVVRARGQGDRVTVEGQRRTRRTRCS